MLGLHFLTHADIQYAGKCCWSGFLNWLQVEVLAYGGGQSVLAISACAPSYTT